MRKPFRKTYKFAGYTATIITLLLTLVMGVFFYVEGIDSYWFLIIFAVVCYVVSFFVIQHRVQKFIYKRVVKIYEDVRLLDAATFTPKRVTTDMETLTKEVERFAENKKLEIESLKIRENYRREFLGNISHELKTPLFTVQGYILTLLDGAMKDKSVRKKYLQRANKGVERLIYIIKDLDMIAKLEIGDLDLQTEVFDIIELVQSIFDLLEMKAAKKNISLTFDIDYPEKVMVLGDRERLQQVVSNLIVNSIKYGVKDGTTEVGIEDFVKNKIIVRITDNGEGVEKEHLPRLFERFFRVDKSGSRKEGGSGLGLAIVKHIIDAHNEKIYVESQVGIGSEFSFTLEKAE
ncbi:MAG TPA: sensor histidine kinase [Flavobacteriaceae bacterium]|nr:sensor histidine kinase [Flavobacteriaceae bacterium]HIN98034.1 sensor histidine kinase [Flavobacteriaceae bacterium]